MASGISVDFVKVKKEIEKLEICVKEIQNFSNERLAAIFDEMKANWQGDSANAYYKKAEQIQKNIISTANSISKVAEMLDSRVNEIYRAEKKATEVAKKSGGFR